MQMMSMEMYMDLICLFRKLFAQAEGCQFDTTRVVMGINPEDFFLEFRRK